MEKKDELEECTERKQNKTYHSAYLQRIYNLGRHRKGKINVIITSYIIVTSESFIYMSAIRVQKTERVLEAEQVEKKLVL